MSFSDRGMETFPSAASFRTIGKLVNNIWLHRSNHFVTAAVLPALLTPPSQKVHFYDLLPQPVFTEGINLHNHLCPITSACPSDQVGRDPEIKGFWPAGSRKRTFFAVAFSLWNILPNHSKSEVVPHSPGLSEMSEEMDLLSCLGFTQVPWKLLPPPAPFNLELITLLAS